MLGIAPASPAVASASERVWALPSALTSTMPSARFAGEGRLTWFGISAYDARLWVAPDFTQRHFDRHAFALELTYQRSFRADDIVRTSLEQMRRVGPIAPETAARWEAQFRPLLHDFVAGDRIVGVNQPGRGASFLINGKPVGEVADPQFARMFFAIWLGTATSQPKLRAALLADTPP
ncbi:chalcone isomerase family protein [Caenimonas koreensis]|uniref:chalcone isomerase family protein n=1 Tax=Caenimonas koreensis TaxID=367474 RepID=UPI00188FA048|nr:chalcone isomerase family protein [Caenimonas koreensis]